MVSVNEQVGQENEEKKDIWMRCHRTKGARYET